jgi:hypothetical protein
MTPEQMLDLLHAALLVTMGGVIYLWWWARTCRCEKCAFHVNEQRVARLTREQEVRDWAESQKHLHHEVAHKGWGYDKGDPDITDCADKACPRNRKVI